jgi:hypothetical protein
MLNRFLRKKYSEDSFSIGEKINILKKRLQTKHCAATPRKTQRKGSTARGCVSAIVRNNILYIHNMELAFN